MSDDEIGRCGRRRRSRHSQRVRRMERTVLLLGIPLLFLLLLLSVGLIEYRPESPQLAVPTPSAADAPMPYVPVP